MRLLSVRHKKNPSMSFACWSNRTHQFNRTFQFLFLSFKLSCKFWCEKVSQHDKILQHFIKNMKCEKPAWFCISFIATRLRKKMRLKIKLDSVQFKCDWSQSVFDIGFSLNLREPNRKNSNRTILAIFSSSCEWHGIQTQKETNWNFSRTMAIGLN